MPRTTGTYAAPTNSVNPAVAGTNIDVSDFNALVDDLETALTESVYTSAGLGATDNRLVRTDGIDTKRLQSTGITVDDSNNVSGIADLTATSATLTTLDVENLTGLDLLAMPTVPFSGMATAINLGIAATVAGNALTVAIKGADGNDPSATNPVYVPFRSSTAATGTPVWRTLSTTNSVTVSSGSTLGSANSVPFAVWVVLFDDSATLRLGVIQSVTGGSAPTAIAALADWNTASSTAEGGAGGADSAGTFYTATAVTSKAYRVLARLEWSSGLATAGTWSSGPTSIQLFVPGMKKPGDVVQIARGEATSATATTSTSFVDSTLSVALTPTSAANLVNVAASGPLGWTSSAGVTIATLTRGSTDFGRNTVLYSNDSSTELLSAMAMIGLDAPGSTSALTYKVRIRTSNASNTATFPVIGSVVASGGTILAQEIMT